MRPEAGEPNLLQLRTESSEETRFLGAALAHGLRPGDVVLLAGDLGSGKTTLAQGIAAGLGVADHVTSPTFTLLRSYPCALAASLADRHGPSQPLPVRTFLHADVYRLDNLGEIVDLAISELVEDGAVAVVEWGDVAEPVFGDDALSVRLAPGTGDDERCVTISASRSWRCRRDELLGLLSAWVAT